MVFFNYATMQMAAKIVYYGPGLCGKTTNLHQIYAKTSPQSRGEMVSLETETDRTLFFDLLPIDVGVIGGFKTRLQLYTVPGQVFYNTTRKLVLKGVDGLVFVADSQRAMLDANVESLANLRENLAQIGTNNDEVPLVLQFNKRDLPNISTVEAMAEALDPAKHAEYVEAVAATGVGVFETLKLISKLTLRTLRRRMTGEDTSRAPAPRAGVFRVQETVRPAAAPSHLTPAPIPPPIAPDLPDAQTATADTPSHPQEIPAAAAAFDAEAAIAASAVPADILAGAPLHHPSPAEAPPEEPAAAPSVEETRPETAIAVAEAEAEPEIDFSRTEKPQKAEPLKTVKVRSSVDVMAELEALRKRATSTTPRTAKRETVTDLSSLRPKRDVSRTLHLQLPAEVLPRARSVRVTLSFEDAEQGVIDTRDQKVELGDTSDVQSLSVNLKIDLAG